MAAAKAPASAASIFPSEAWRAASALEAAGTHSAPGRWLAPQRRHWGWARGWPLTVRTSASLVPGRASSAKAIGSCSSAWICRSPPAVRSSRVAVTTPSTELSIGTTARSAVPARTAASAAWMVGQGSGWAAEAASSARKAASVKVPSGPR